MQAYQFTAITENGFIRIPEDIKTKIGDKIKVIIESDIGLDTNWDELFPPIVDTTIWKFNREEANER